MAERDEFSRKLRVTYVSADAILHLRTRCQRLRVGRDVSVIQFNECCKHIRSAIWIDRKRKFTIIPERLPGLRLRPRRHCTPYYYQPPNSFRVPRFFLQLLARFRGKIFSRCRLRRPASSHVGYSNASHGVSYSILAFLDYPTVFAISHAIYSLPRTLSALNKSLIGFDFSNYIVLGYVLCDPIGSLIAPLPQLWGAPIVNRFEIG